MSLFNASNIGPITVFTTEMSAYPEQGTTTVVKDVNGNTVLIF